MKTLLLVFIFLGSLPAIAGKGLYYQNGSIYSTVQTFYNQESEKTVHVIGMIHVGPEQYFNKIKKVLEGVHTNDAILLEEFATCDNQNVVYDLASCDSELLEKSFEGVKFPVSVDFFHKQKSDFYNRLHENGVLRKVSCELDSYSGHYRPVAILERNERRCREANRYDLTCQHEVDFQGLRYNTNTSDLRLNQNNFADHLLTSLLYRTSPDQACNRNKFVSNLALKTGNDGVFSIYNVINNFNLSYRDHLLFLGIEEGLKKANTIVTLWGAMHSQKVGNYLSKRNFQLVKNESIYFINEAEAKGWPGFKEIVDNIDFVY